MERASTQPGMGTDWQPQILPELINCRSNVRWGSKAARRGSETPLPRWPNQRTSTDQTRLVGFGPEAEVHGNETASDHALSGDVEHSCMVRAEFIW